MENIEKQELKYVVQRVDCPREFLRFEFVNATPGFTQDLGFASKYDSEETVNKAIELIHQKGHAAKLKARPLLISYQVGMWEDDSN